MGAATGAYLHQPESGELRWMGETSTYFLATGEQTGETFALVDEQGKRGDSVPLHLHRDDMESFYVVDGEITLYIGDQPGVRASAGSFAHLPGGTVHGFRIESETARSSFSLRRVMGSSTARSRCLRDQGAYRRSSRSTHRRSSRPTRSTASS